MSIEEIKQRLSEGCFIKTVTGFDLVLVSKSESIICELDDDIVWPNIDEFKLVRDGYDYNLYRLTDKA